MKRKLWLSVIIVAVVSSIAFGGKQLATNWLTPLFNTKSEIPDHILYETIFRMRKRIGQRTKIDKDRKEGKAAVDESDLLKKKFDLTADEDAKLSQVADEFAEAIASVDARAKEITDDYRKQHSDGNLQEGEQLPPPPDEIAELQELRNAIVLNNRDKFHLAIGSEKFAEVDEKVRGEFAESFRDLTNRITTRRPK